MNAWPPLSCVVLTSLVVAILSGCGQGPQLPADLPPLTSCVVHVNYNNSPVSEATVTLVPTDGKWVGVGLTDAQGKATIKTQGRYAGIPQGSYTVTVTKYAEQAEPPPTASTPEEDAQMAQAASQLPPRKPLVPKKYLEEKSSDLKVTVTENSVDETFELKDA
ncbi:carboxypeptidase-like regulatory domain-containing protein [Bremerella sp. JC770]|uniref:carboxypeptidase-like regulatory domain-containing protein n=1 Tax=Bremerella sp. JC770 TaxID=3232137 RepID=UPI003459CAE1